MELTTSPSKLNFRLWLQSKLMERCRNNPSYSLRAFAQFLEMDSSSVSQIISGKRKASSKVISKVCEKLSVAPSLRQQFLKEGLRKKTTALAPSNEAFELMAEDAFAYISNWYHYAILELTSTESFSFDAQWISRTLSVSVTEVKMAIDRMVRLGLLREHAGQLIKTNNFVTNFTPGFTSSGNKELQRQVLQKALHAIDHCPQERKDITSMTMAIDVEKLPEAKKVITKFRRDMCAFLEDGEQTEVYNLAIQLYPLSQNEIHRSQS